MSVPIDVDLTMEAAKRAQLECMELFRDLIPRNIGPQGETYGTQLMDRGDRIAAFLDRRASGALDILKGIAPHWYEQLVKDFEEDTASSPLFSHVQYAERIRESGATTAYDEQNPLQGVF